MLLRQDSYRQLMIISCNDHLFSTLFINLETTMFFLLSPQERKHFVLLQAYKRIIVFSNIPTFTRARQSNKYK